MADAASSKITIEPQKIIANHNLWAGGERSDASSAGTRREAIGSFCDKNGIENKAFSQVRAGLKIKNDGKRKDWLRSLQLLLPVAEAEIFGNQPDMLDAGGQEPDAAPVDEPNDNADDGGVAAEPEPETEDASGDPDIAEEAAGFDNNVKAVEFGQPA